MPKKKRWCDRTPEYKARKARKKGLKKFGLTPEDFDARSERQHHKCLLCDKIPNGKRLSVHFDKKLKRVRGLLCERCRRYIQFIGLNIDRIETAMGYLIATGE